MSNYCSNRQSTNDSLYNKYAFTNKCGGLGKHWVRENCDIPHYVNYNMKLNGFKTYMTKFESDDFNFSPKIANDEQIKYVLVFDIKNKTKYILNNQDIRDAVDNNILLFKHTNVNNGMFINIPISWLINNNIINTAA